MKKKIIIIGGDKRFTYLQKMLEAHFDVIPFTDKDLIIHLYKNIEDSDVVLLPYPITFDGNTVNAPLYKKQVLLSDVFSHLKSNHILLTGGKLPKEFRAEEICRTYDYAASEELLWANAELTAEGLLRLVIEELPIALTATSVAVLGAGRVGTETAKLLSRAGCKVTIFARSTKDFETKVLPFDYFHQHARNFDCVINTIPALVLDESRLSALRPECLILEAASAPYGLDFRAADRHGIKSIIAGSLPGKIAPKTAAEIICKSVIQLC